LRPGALGSCNNQGAHHASNGNGAIDISHDAPSLFKDDLSSLFKDDLSSPPTSKCLRNP
jgi:hypothetical protein